MECKKPKLFIPSPNDLRRVAEKVASHLSTDKCIVICQDDKKEIVRGVLTHNKN